MDIKEAREILRLSSQEITVQKAFKVCSAYWVYKGNSGEPHPLLASKLHSDGYLNLNAVLQFSNLCRFLAREIAVKIAEESISKRLKSVDVVVSSSFAAISLGQVVADELGVISVFTEKKNGDQVWTGRFELPSGARILQVEELITTLGTTQKVRAAVLEENSNVEFVKSDGKTVVATVVHRPLSLPIDYPDYKVIPLIALEIHKWEPEKCPLCKKGSVALEPKPNWLKFVKYMQ